MPEGPLVRGGTLGNRGFATPLAISQFIPQNWSWLVMVPDSIPNFAQGNLMYSKFARSGLS